MVGSTAVDDSAYAVPTHTKSSPCRSCTMVGSAVETPVCEWYRDKSGSGDIDWTSTDVFQGGEKHAETHGEYN